MHQSEQSDARIYSQQTVIFAALGSVVGFGLASIIFMAVSDYVAFDRLFQRVVSALSSILFSFFILHYRHFLAGMAKFRRFVCLSIFASGIFFGLFILTILIIFVGVGFLTLATRSTDWIPQ